MRIQTVEGDISPEEAGATLAHEHLWAAFGDASCDSDLQFTCAAQIAADVAEASAEGIRTFVDVTTEDMGADVARSVAIAAEGDVRMVKSTGWFRSPFADSVVEGRTVQALSERLVENLTAGFPDSPYRAGCLGEIGIAGTHPTPVEERVLDATATASLATGAGIVLHTDDADNGRCLVESLLRRGAAPERLLVGHARADDPLEWHLELAEQGSMIGFDQLGHPLRDAPERSGERILELSERGWGHRIVTSADVGRRSRLRAFGGSGYASGVARLVAFLRRAELDPAQIERLAGGAAAEFLAIEEPA